MKFEFNWPSGFRGEDVWNCGRTDGRRSDWYTFSSPMSLRLRWAKNEILYDYSGSQQISVSIRCGIHTTKSLQLQALSKTLFILNSASMKFILLINVKMPTIVGILTFMSMINTTFNSLKARKVFICQHFSFYEQLQFHAQLRWAWKKFYNLRARLSNGWIKCKFDKV